MSGAFGSMQTEGKYGSYNIAQLEELTQMDTPSSPQGGATSQGALEPSPSGGEASPPAFGDEGKGAGEARKPVSDFHRMHMESTAEEQDAVADKMEEQFGVQGLSLQGAVNQVFEQGGETAAQLAERFGYLPPEGSGGKEAFKTREQALADYDVDLDMAVERGAVETKKQNNRRAMGGFLMDIGLRILASNREGVSAVGEGALSAMDSRRNRNRQAKQDERDAEDRTIAGEDRKRRMAREDEADEAGRLEAEARKEENAESRTIAQQNRERRIRREDEADEAGRLEAEARKEERAYQKTQRAAEEAKTARAGMKLITNEAGEQFYFDPLNPKGGKWVVGMDGKRILSEDVGLSKESIAAAERQFKRDVNAKVEKIKGMDEYEREELYPATKGLKGEKLMSKIIELSRNELASQSDDGIADYNNLDW